MPINRIVKGDLLEIAETGEFDAIVHGCNCFCNMGAGIARQIKKKYPGAYEADCMTDKGDKKKLGNYSVSKNPDSVFVINAYTQFDYLGRGVKADYNAIRRVFTEINQNFYGICLGIPKIGAGLAKGDWNLIKSIINESTPDLNITVVEYQHDIAEQK